MDIGEHAYVQPAADWLADQFPARFSLSLGDCLIVLPALAEEGRTFDAFHIDGAKFTHYEDILNCQRLMSGERALIIVDASQLQYVANVWRRCVRQGLIKPLQAFPSMPTTYTYRNEIGELQRISPLRLRVLQAYCHAIKIVRRGRRYVGRVSRPVRRRLTQGRVVA